MQLVCDFIFQVAKVSAEDVKKKLSQCGKLEELKSQLSKMNEIKAKLKTPVPKLEQFDKMTVEVEVPRLVNSSVNPL